MFNMSMGSASVKSTFESALANMKGREKQVRLAAAKAITFTIERVQTEEVREMQRIFDRPTPFTLNSIRKTTASPSNLQARVFLKDDGVRGHRHYLYPQIEGGTREQKFYETVFTMIGVKAGEMQRQDVYIVPGSGAKLDQYGNMSRGQIRQILSALGKAQRTAGYSANRTAASARRKGKRLVEYFIGRPGGGRLPFGVYMRTKFAFGSAIKPVLIFVKQPQYQKRFDFYGVAERTVIKEFPALFSKELRRIGAP